MDEIIYRRGCIPDASDILTLYADAGWSAYTNDMPRLMEALHRSLLIITAWDDGQLVGLIRLVGDGLTIIYVQDIIVLSSHRRRRIGTYLLQLALRDYPDVRQKVLLTDNTPQTRRFYELLGLKSCEKLGMAAFIQFT